MLAISLVLADFGKMFGQSGETVPRGDRGFEIPYWELVKVDICWKCKSFALWLIDKAEMATKKVLLAKETGATGSRWGITA